MNLVDQAKAVLFKKSRIHKSYQHVFATDDGKIVLSDLCRRYKVFIPKTYSQGDHAFNDGAIQAILSILHYAKLNHEKLVSLMEQQVNDYEDIT